MVLKAALRQEVGADLVFKAPLGLESIREKSHGGGQMTVVRNKAKLGIWGNGEKVWWRAKSWHSE